MWICKDCVRQMTKLIKYVGNSPNDEEKPIHCKLLFY